MEDNQFFTQHFTVVPETAYTEDTYYRVTEKTYIMIYGQPFMSFDPKGNPDYLAGLGFELSDELHDPIIMILIVIVVMLEFDKDMFTDPTC